MAEISPKSLDLIEKSGSAVVVMPHGGHAWHQGRHRLCDGCLADGTRGFVQSQMMQAIGFKKNIPVPRFLEILAELAPKSLDLIEKSGSPVIMPHGGHAKFTPYEVIPEIVSGVIRAAR